MSKLKITKGNWVAVKSLGRFDVLVNPYSPLHTTSVCSLFGSAKEDEVKGNVNIIIDAANTANKCGLLPSELLEQRDDLLKALQTIASTLEWRDGMAVETPELKRDGELLELAYQAITKVKEGTHEA